MDLDFAVVAEPRAPLLLRRRGGAINVSLSLETSEPTRALERCWARPGASRRSYAARDSAMYKQSRHLRYRACSDALVTAYRGALRQPCFPDEEPQVLSKAARQAQARPDCCGALPSRQPPAGLGIPIGLPASTHV